MFMFVSFVNVQVFCSIFRIAFLDKMMQPKDEIIICSMR